MLLCCIKLKVNSRARQQQAALPVMAHPGQRIPVPRAGAEPVLICCWSGPRVPVLGTLRSDVKYLLGPGGFSFSAGVSSGSVCLVIPEIFQMSLTTQVIFSRECQAPLGEALITQDSICSRPCSLQGTKSMVQHSSFAPSGGVKGAGARSIPRDPDIRQQRNHPSCVDRAAGWPRRMHCLLPGL